jgi:hypothetical protein
MSDLMLDPELSKRTLDSLLEWMASQEFESTAILGLLVLLRTSMRGGGSLIPQLSVLQKCIVKPSILSWMLLTELVGSPVDHKSSLAHSAEAPRNFSPVPLFEKYVRAYLPPIYDMWAKELEERLVSFKRQWAYEWSALRTNSPIQPSDRTLQFWLGTDYEEERYLGADMPMSELYRSAYLRALAWLVTSERIGLREAIRTAAKVCPVDLELWKLDPSCRPEWWPWVEESGSALDVVPAQVWPKVAELWEDQQADFAEWLLTQASGPVHLSSVKYHLEIQGVFQKNVGPAKPNLEDISRWYSNENSIHPRFYSPLRFAGLIEPRSLDSEPKRSGGWDVIPASAQVVQVDSPRWQFWRMYRGIWLPTPFFEAERVRFEVSNGSVAVFDENEIVAKWNDWTSGLSERLGRNIPPPTGQFLFSKRTMIKAFLETNNASFCWVCKLTGFHRQDKHRPYKTFSDFREFGSTRIIRT